MNVRITVVASFLAALASQTGCNDYKLSVAPVRGTVMCEGEPLETGTIVFAPINEGTSEPGKSAMGAIGPGGAFTLSTYEANDGAVVGKHRVTYLPPPAEGEGEEEDEESAASLPALPLADDHPCRNGGTSPTEVEVTSGENDLTIELSGLSSSGEVESDSEEE